MLYGSSIGFYNTGCRKPFQSLRTGHKLPCCLNLFLLLLLFSEAIFGTWLQFMRQTEQFIKDNPDIPVFNVSFEETKEVS